MRGNRSATLLTTSVTYIDLMASRIRFKHLRNFTLKQPFHCLKKEPDSLLL